jgi:hypothetical protein
MTLDRKNDLARYALLMQIARTGAYSEGPNGEYFFDGEDINLIAIELEEKAHNEGLTFSEENGKTVLREMAEDEKAKWAKIQAEIKEEIARQVEHEMSVSQITRSHFSGDEAYQDWQLNNL